MSKRDRDTYHVRAVYGSPPRRDYEKDARDFADRMRLHAEIEAMTTATMVHELTRVEAVCAAILAEVCTGCLPELIRRCRVETHGHEKTVRLDGVAIWRGGWRWPQMGDAAFADSKIAWAEEWADAAPPDVRAAALLVPQP